jgi:replicative DNA helicase
MFVYREAVYCDSCRKRDGSCTQNHDRTAEVIIGKQRNGALGTVNLAFYGEHTRFENLSDREN